MAYAATRARAGERLVERFTDFEGRAREVLARDEECGAVTLFERPADGNEAPRLVGVLGRDEPPGNAELLAGLFVADAAVRSIRCNRLGSGNHEEEDDPPATPAPDGVTDPEGRSWRLALVSGALRLPEVRWLDDAGVVVSVRDVVAAVQSYAPVREATRAALGMPEASTASLRAELDRMLESPILLNRCLRERVSLEVGSGRLTMGEIALRCGRTKRDGSGTRSGDTSWLARRVGLLPEAGRSRPTPWVHTEVLALIARSGLNLSPHEIETP